MLDQGKEIPSPQPQEVVKSSGEIKRVQNGLRVALAGVVFGAWSIGVANAYAQNIVQESDKQFSIRHQESSQDYRLEFEQKPDLQISERVNIPQRSVIVEDLDQTISDLQQESLGLRRDLNELEVKNNPGPDYVAAKNAEVNSLNQIASSLEKFKAEIEIMEQDLNKDDQKPKELLDNATQQVETAKQNLITRSQILQKELAERFSSTREQELLRRANGESMNAMSILQKAGPDKNKQADDNLKLAQEQKNLMEHHVASLHHDADIIKSYLEKGNLPTKEEIKTLSEHAQERTKWFLKYWQLEQQRANFKLDPQKDETIDGGKNYHQWVEYEIREAKNQQNLYLDPEKMEETAEGAFLSSYLQFDEVRRNEIRVGIQFNTIYPYIVNSQRETLESLKNFIDREWVEINHLTDGDSLATDLKSYALARAWREMNYWSYQAQRLQILSDQTPEFKEAEDRAKIAEAHLRQLLGGHNFSSEGDLVEGLKPLAAKLPDGNFTQTAEHAFLQAHQYRVKEEENQSQEIKLLKDKIGELKQLSWNGYFDYGRNADRSRMSTAYRQYLDDVDAVKNSDVDLTRYDQDPQGIKESGNEQAIRDWLRIMTKNERPDKYHSAEADWLTAVGGNINLYKGTPFEKYFDQFLAPGEVKSFRELASWIQLSLKERSPLDQEKFISDVYR